MSIHTEQKEIRSAKDHLHVYQIGRHKYSIPSRVRKEVYDVLQGDGWYYCIGDEDCEKLPDGEMWVTAYHASPLYCCFDEEAEEVVKAKVNETRKKHDVSVLDDDVMVTYDEECNYWTDSDDEDNDNFMRLFFQDEQ